MKARTVKYGHCEKQCKRGASLKPDMNYSPPYKLKYFLELPVTFLLGMCITYDMISIDSYEEWDVVQGRRASIRLYLKYIPQKAPNCCTCFGFIIGCPYFTSSFFDQVL